MGEWLEKMGKPFEWYKRWRRPGGRLCAPGGRNTSAASACGAHWERQAQAYLKRRGLSMIEANFRCAGGEIDLIMREGATIVFVEVRQRSSASHGGAAASVTVHKQRRLLRAAQTWLQRYPAPPPCRIDVVAVDGAEIAWLRDAVQAPG